MLTKYILHIGLTDYELQDEDLKNWDEIRCSYKRSSYDGVVRSFTSKFEFVNRAYELLKDVYLCEGFNANVILEVLTMNDSWTFDKQFECPLDFSTIEWENGILSINAVDNSIAALIKANKSTKYELLVGSQIPTAGNLKITRLPMKENLIYGFTQGVSYDDCEDITVSFKQGELPWVGNKGSEIVINQTLDWNDDQETDPGSHILKAIKDVKVKFSYRMGYRSNRTANSVGFSLLVRRGGDVLPIYGADANGCSCGSAQKHNKHNFGSSFTSPSQLPDISSPQWSDSTKTTDWRYTGYAIVNGIVWECKYHGWNFTWENTEKTEDEYFVVELKGSAVLNLLAGDVVYMEHTMPPNIEISTVRFTYSEFLFEWMAVGEDAYVSVCSPQKVAKSLLQKIAGNAMNVHVDISDFDSRFANTYIMAAESVRLIPSAKLYTSFNEFCDWMSAVFGYVYYIGDAVPTKYPNRCDFGRVVGTPYQPSGTYSGAVDTAKIMYNSYRKCFFYAGEGGYYAQWNGWQDYNHPGSGYPRTDTVFFERGASTVKAWVFPEYTGESNLNPIEYEGDDDIVGADDQTVYFVHRSELLRPDADVKRFDHCRDLKYTADSSLIYASITAGYDKKEYESVNGRDEFNFNNTYTTGCTVTDKTLSLLSKYRADSYGIEFAIQKRSKDTTDTTSDKDVFFIHCTKESGGQLIADRTCDIKNGISDALFNGVFSPMACIMANAGYIGLQAAELQLTFASSTGNSDIEIDGVPMSSNLTLNTPLATVGSIEFTTDEIEMNGDENDLIEVESDGVLYRGFLKDVDIKYARAEAAKYKLIVKDIVP